MRNSEAYGLAKKDQKVLVWHLFFIVFISIAPFKLYSQDNRYSLELMRGRLINARTRQAIPFASVINKNLRTGVTADSAGVFIISAHRSDTLYIKATNFYPMNLPMSDSMVWQIRIPQISLREQVYELAGVDLSNWGTYQQFKYKVLHNIPPVNKNLDKTKSAIEKSIAALPAHPLQEQAAIPLGSPVTALYMLFSKEGKSLRRLEKAKDQNQIFLRTYQKYNRVIVSEITGLTGNLLDEFIMFSRPDDDFLLSANDYEITVRVLEDFDRFKEVLRKRNQTIPNK